MAPLRHMPQKKKNESVSSHHTQKKLVYSGLRMVKFWEETEEYSHDFELDKIFLNKT